MDSTEYTPGPWRLEGRCVITDGHQHSDRNSEIATVSGSREFGTTSQPGELAANARLIAAAPELLMALKAMLVTHSAHNEWAHDARAKACEAIAKATGEL